MTIPNFAINFLNDRVIGL